jgi:cytochrome c peroxidase
MTCRAIFRLRILIVLAFLLAIIAQANTPTRFELKLPLGVPADVWQYFVPKDNPMTAAKVELGRQLFFDKRLSLDGTIACATCHDPQLAFTDGKPLAEGVSGRRGTRNSPTVLNAMFNSSQFWDGRVESLEAQAKLPLTSPDEMGNESHEQVVARLQAVPEYVKQFREVFGGPVTIDGLAKAIAAFERTLVSANSPLDRFSSGDAKALSPAAQRGSALYRGKARCNVCHNINVTFPFLTDGQYRNTGVAMNNPGFESLSQRAAQASKNGPSASELEALGRLEGAGSLGRFLTTGNVLDIGAFRTPSLRDIELTAPYFHDGSAKTLADVVRYYVKGGNHNRYRDWQLEPVDLTDSEQSDLIEFLKSLTSDDTRRLVQK